MCGRYSAGQLSLPLLAEQFQAEPEVEEHHFSWNVVPTSQVLVVTSVRESARDAAGDQAADGHAAGKAKGKAGSKTGGETESKADGKAGDQAGGEAEPVETSRRLRRLRWGLVPNWAKDPKIGNKMINVRGESVTEKPTFKRLLASNRCILPADGFYEWQDLGPDPEAGSGRKRQRKQPFYITTQSGEPLALAGLWTVNKHADPSGPVETCTILTVAANKLMSSIHHRMPVILPEAAWDTWLDPDFDDVDKLAELLVPAPDDMLRMWPVDSAVSSPRSNHPDLIRPLEGHEPRTSP
jgi:putative SOS response-associated peptidase YedK